MNHPPVVIVDDKGGKRKGERGNGLFARYETAVEYAWPGREVRCFETLRSACEILHWQDPFVLILDHNMEAGVDEQVADLLGVDASTPLFGYHLCAALRRQHDFGLAIPVAYLTGLLSGKDFLHILDSEGPFLPNFWVDKNTDPRRPDELIRQLDDYANLLLANLRRAADRVFLASIPVDGDDLSDLSRP